MGAKKDGGGANPAAARPAQDDKAARLAAALRANLKRRKAQQRDRAEPAKSGDGDSEPVR
jgi:hypothetical protein